MRDAVLADGCWLLSACLGENFPVSESAGEAAVSILKAC